MTSVACPQVPTASRSAPSSPRSSPPPNPPEFRVGVEALIANDDVVGVEKLMFQEMMTAMHEGTLTEWADAWLTDDNITVTGPGLHYSTTTRGKEEWLLDYNELITDHYDAPNNTLTYNFEGAVRVGHRTVRVDLRVETAFPTKVMVEEITYENTFNDEFKVCYSHWKGRQAAYASPAAAIQPINTKLRAAKPSLPAASTKEATDSVGPPSFTRPCLHNNWDSVRTKKGVILLRCRTCLSQWKVPSFEFYRCRRFLESPSLCHLGTLCPHLHVHAKKQTYEDKLMQQNDEA